jgi:membrane peptidoglycan carboxypeptidase
MVPSYTDGSNGIDILHEDAAYAAVAARGIYCPPVAITSVTQVTQPPAGDRAVPVAVPPAHCHRVISAGIADEVTKILRGVITQPLGTAYGYGIPGREAAGKTGTTDHEAMALFAGYTPQLSAVVWYGDPAFPFGDPTGQYGRFTVPYWEQSMQHALAGQPAVDFTEPGGAYGRGGAAGAGNRAGNHRDGRRRVIMALC